MTPMGAKLASVVRTAPHQEFHHSVRVLSMAITITTQQILAASLAITLFASRAQMEAPANLVSTHIILANFHCVLAL